MSGRRNIIQKYQVLTNSNSTLSENAEHTDVSGADNVTYEAKCEASVLGELKVTVCNDKTLTSLSEFKPLNFGAQTILNGSNDTEYTYKIINHGFKWMRLEFVNNGGTGLINAWISGNSVGA